MKRLTPKESKETLIAGCALGVGTFLLSFGVVDIAIAAPLGVIAGMGGALVTASPWKAKAVSHLRTKLLVEYGQRTPLIEEIPQVNRQSQTLQRRVPMVTERRPEVRERATVDRNLAQQLTAEIDAINLTLRSLKINAGTKPALTVVGGDQMVFFTIKAAPSQKISKIESCLPELSDAISTLRRKQTLVRMLRYPLRLEVEHPFYKPLWWDVAALDGKPNEVLIGKSYDNGPANVRLAFSGNPHMLVAGTTGAGKSVLINAMIMSLAWNTSPDDLAIYLVDMKNKSLAPLRELPHVKRFASDVETAAGVVKMAGAALDAQIQNRNVADHRQHLIVIDEYADLSDDASTMSIINHIVRMGRDDAVNAIVGTQHPTSSVLGDDGTKQNFPVRIVGPVTDANAANVALGVRGSNAHLLPVERGAFLLRRGPELTRVNTYLLTPDDVAATVALIRQKWGTSRAEPLEPVLRKSHTLLVVEPLEPTVEPVQNRSEPFVEPITEKRPLTYDEACQVRLLYDEGLSKTALCNRVYGSKNGQYLTWINEAIADQRPASIGDGKIIKMRRAV